MQQAAQRNCLYARDLMSDVQNGLYSQPVQSSPSSDKSHASRHEVSQNPYEELSNLIGLNSVKTEIESLSNFVKIQALRQKQGKATAPISLHCVLPVIPEPAKQLLLVSWLVFIKNSEY